MSTSIIIASLLLVMGIVILTGKGDMLIAGYNTASKEEKAKVNIKRLRLLVGGLLIFIAIPLCFLPALDDDNILTYGPVFIAVVMVLTPVFLVLANTWAKKK